MLMYFATVKAFLFGIAYKIMYLLKWSLICRIHFIFPSRCDLISTEFIFTRSMTSEAIIGCRDARVLLQQ